MCECPTGWRVQYVYVYDWLFNFCILAHADFVNVFFVTCFYDDPDDRYDYVA